MGTHHLNLNLKKKHFNFFFVSFFILNLFTNYYLPEVINALIRNLVVNVDEILYKLYIKSNSTEAN